MPPLMELAAVLFLSGVVSYGLTQVLKALAGKWVGRDVNSSDPPLWQAFFRVIPIIIGTSIGWFFFTPQWGLSVGASGGVLSVILYKKATSLVEDIRSPQK
tara:strand:+ start:8121 stop:8423 length:303 start_codon:yes stop_codon:yes gene_type:complete